MTSAITIIVLASVAVLVAWIIRLARAYQEKQLRTLRQYGFQQLHHPDPELERKLSISAGRQKGQARLRNVYLHAAGEYDLYRYTLARKQGDNSVQYALVLRNRLLPTFAVMPNLKLPGFLNNLIAKLFEHVVAGSGLSEYSPPGAARFGEKYRLYVMDQRQVQQSMPATTWESLEALPATLILQADSDVVVFQELPYGEARKRTKLEVQLRFTLTLAQQLYDCVRGVHPVTA